MRVAIGPSRSVKLCETRTMRKFSIFCLFPSYLTVFTMVGKMAQARPAKGKARVHAPRLALPFLTPIQPTVVTATDALEVSNGDYQHIPLSGQSGQRPSSPEEENPLKAYLDKFEMADRTLDSVCGFVRQDLLEASSASVEDWVDLFLGVPRSALCDLTTKIGEEKWFRDRAIQKHLKAYCYAKSEAQRCSPATLLFQRIIAKARDAMKKSALGLPAGDCRKSFPIADAQFVNHSNTFVCPPPIQGVLASKRHPDLLLVRARSAKRKISWPDVLTWFELKFVNNLTGAYNGERVARGLRRCTDYVVEIAPDGVHGRVRAQNYPCRCY